MATGSAARTCAGMGNLAGRAVPLKHLSDLEAALEEAMAHPPSEVRQLIMAVTQQEK